jgi:putative transposase
MLRERVPKKRIFLKPEERERLLELGKELGSGLKHILTIVSYRTYLRWIRQTAMDKKPVKMGRPRTPKDIQQIILRIAKETGWGYTRILGELKKLGIFSVSRNTVKNLLKANGYDPGPKRGKGTWDEFLRIHAETLWQCDFFSKKIWTTTGLRQCFVLAFLHVGTRRVFVTKASYKPDAAWMRTQAEAFLEHVEAEGMRCTHLIRDYDGMFGKGFDATLRDSDVDVKKVGPQASNMNAFVERWNQSIKQEALDHFIVFGQDHFNYLVSNYVDYYLHFRPHQALANKPLKGTWPEEEEQPPPDGDIVCHTWLGGLLRHYERLCRARHNPSYADFRVMPTEARFSRFLASHPLVDAA